MNFSYKTSQCLHCAAGLRTMLWIAIAVTATTIMSCKDEESQIGMGLQDPASLFSGQHDTVILEGATYYDDSLLTTGYGRAVIGRVDNSIFGTTRATYYTQIANANGLDWNENCHIDSVILQLAVEDIFAPTRAARQDLHTAIQVFHTTDKIMTDTPYYATSTIGLGQKYADQPITITDSMMTRVNSDSLLNFTLKLDTSIFQLFPRRTLTPEALLDATKGIAIKLDEGSGYDIMTMTLNLAAATNKMTIYYSYHANGSSTINRTVGMSIGSGATHFSSYIHTYNAPFSSLQNKTADSLGGSQRLYLEPLGGTYMKLNMKNWVETFRVKHPTAVIAYAVIKLPVATESVGTEYPSRLYTYKNYADGSTVLIPDFTDAYRLTGYDGTNHLDKAYYRIRVTEHVQKMLHSGNDFGTLIYLEGRRSDPRSVVFNGTGTATPPRLEIVYSE